MSRQELEKVLTNFPDIHNKDIYIWGTGNTALLYQEGLKRLESENTLSVKGYIDNNSEKMGSIFL